MAKGYKWWRMLYLKRDASLAGHLPATKTLAESNLSQMLGQHRKLIVKPMAGSGGIGVIQVSGGKDGVYSIHKNASTIKVSGEKRLYGKIKGWTKGQSYMIQQRIPLGEVGGSPFDVRVMVQRSRTSDWTITGKLAKIAGPGYIVTNIHRSHGRVTTVTSAVRRSDVQASSTGIHAELDRVALQAARRLGKKYPYQRVFGLDMGIDKEGKVWIIEANFAPSVSLFKKLKDKKAYYRILRYKKS